MNAPKMVAPVFAPLKTLTVTKMGSGTGSVISTAPAAPSINCGITCSATYLSYINDQYTSVSLTAIPDPGKLFTGWSGACSGTGQCNVTMDINRPVTANFSASNLVKVGILLYATFQSAYDSAITGSEIKLFATNFNESPILNRPVGVTVHGGYSSNFTDITGRSVVQGVLTISSGSVIVDGLQIGGH